jgi:hypothetical protein
MHSKIVAVIAIILTCLFAQSNPCWSRALLKQQGIVELSQNNAEPSNDIIETITSYKTPVRNSEEYSCFPWIFNPGKYTGILIYIDV